MRSLKVLCNDSGFPEAQKLYFESEVGKLLAEGGTGKEGALFCLRILWQYYDSGGHSLGRSFRSVILEKIVGWLHADGRVADKVCLQNAKTLLSIFVAMHYDYEYINRQEWFDYRLEDISQLPLRDRVFVSAAALALGVDSIPSLEEWDRERLEVFLNRS